MVLAGDVAWADYRLSVTLGSDSPQGDIGVVFRRQDKDNYYRFSMGQTSTGKYQRLIRKSGGTVVDPPLWQDPDAGYAPGQMYKLTIECFGKRLVGYLDDELIFDHEEDDGLQNGRVGLYCWSNPGARFDDVGVDLTNPSHWSFTDEGDQEGPSEWKVLDGELRQKSNIHGEDPAKPEYKPGTLALVGDAAWTDYRLSATLGSDSPQGDIGVVFRHQDAPRPQDASYYRFSMGRTPTGEYRRLIRKSGDAIEELPLEAPDAGYVPGQMYELTVECVGDRLVGYLDNELIFTVKDDSLSSGRVGLYCWSNPGARFDDVSLSPAASAAWTPYYTFGQEPRLPAGTRVRVYAGPTPAEPSEPVSEDRGVERRWTNNDLHLPPEDTELRLVPVTGTEGHTRRFLPENSYKPLDGARLVRKADGTAFFILMPAPSSAEKRPFAAQYRLKLTYRRDNRGKDPSSIVFSEAGNSTPESVTLDVPWATHQRAN